MVLRRVGLVAYISLVLGVLAFAAYCVDLMLDVRRLRSEVEVRVGWLVRAQELLKQPDAGATTSLRLSVTTHPEAQTLAMHLEDPLKGPELFTRAVRGEMAELSGRLGQRWDALNVVALVALAFAGLSLALIGVLRRRQRLAEAAQARLAETNADLMRATAAAREAAEGKSRLVAYVSHEFRTPLQAIMGMVGLLEESSGSNNPEQRRRYMSTLRSASEDLLRLVDGLLDVARIESGHLTIRVHEFSMRALFEQVSMLLEANAEKKGIELRTVLPADLPRTLRGDRMRLRQVLINLAGNAIKFTKRGHVELRARFQMIGTLAHVRIEVEDTGPGITPEAQARLFQPFVRGANESGIAQVEGTGLGLSISKQLVEALGGRLGLESTPGVGSMFWFELELPVVAGSSRTPEPSRAPASGLRVLVADDDLASRTLVTAALERGGYTVVGVGDGLAAVECAVKQSFAAVVLDVELPELDGPGAARRIRAERGELPMLALTGHTDDATRERCKAAGIDEVLVKPVRIDVLRTTLARMVEGGAGPLDLAVVRGYATAEDPSFLPRLIDVYLVEADRDTATLREAVERGERDVVASLAHRLKGSSAGFGARVLADRCQALFTAARASAALSADLAGVLQEYAGVRVALQRERARLAARRSS